MNPIRTLGADLGRALRIWWEALFTRRNCLRHTREVVLSWGAFLIICVHVWLAAGAAWQLLDFSGGRLEALVLEVAVGVFLFSAWSFLYKFPMNSPRVFLKLSPTAAKVMYKRDKGTDGSREVARETLLHAPAHQFVNVVSVLAQQESESARALVCELLLEARPAQVQAFPQDFWQHCLTSSDREFRDTAFRALRQQKETREKG